uniref:NAD-dependent epimerase/dehydratase domain-containing protein n=1 Tax=Acrobeloides nanus TaxID=290746 RepID=A0A914C119_9BILA
MKLNKNCTKVLVTGASGYLATHCVQQLLNAGYLVRGTVRSLKVLEKVQPLKNLSYAKERLELIEADLEKKETWPSIVDSCDYVLHVASPFPAISNETTIKTAIEGTKNVLTACSKTASVKKLVLTSSIASIVYGHRDYKNRIFTENDWSNLERCSAYQKSKTLAEKFAWYFMRANGENSFKMTCLNPGFIVGPSLTEVAGTSVTLVKRLLNNEMDSLPLIQYGLVDVRDVAKAHILAMENPKSDSERIIINSNNLWLHEIAEILEKEFGPKGYIIPTKKSSYFNLWLNSFYNPNVKEILGRVEKKITMDNSKRITL